MSLALLAVPARNAFAGESGMPAPATNTSDAEAPARRGLTPSLIYEGTVLANLAGGRRTGSTAVGNLHLMLTAHADVFGHPGTAAFVDVLWLHGGLPGNLAGDAQRVSNIAGPVGVVLEEAWVQQEFSSHFVSVLAGIYDLNSEFYALQACGLFLNGSFGIGPEFAQSGVEGPSIFPRTSVGLRVAWKPGPDAVVRVALLDGAPVVRQDQPHAAFRRGDGVLGVVEVAAPSHLGRSEARTLDVVDRIGRFASLVPFGSKLAAGVWYYSGPYDDLSEAEAGGQAVRRHRQQRGLCGGRGALWTGAAAGRHLSVFSRPASRAHEQTGSACTWAVASSRPAGVRCMTATRSAWPSPGPSMALTIDVPLRKNRCASPARKRRSNSVTWPVPANPWSCSPICSTVVRPYTSRVLRNAWVLQCRFQLSL